MRPFEVRLDPAERLQVRSKSWTADGISLSVERHAVICHLLEGEKSRESLKWQTFAPGKTFEVDFTCNKIKNSNFDFSLPSNHNTRWVEDLWLPSHLDNKWHCTDFPTNMGLSCNLGEGMHS